MSSSQYGYNAAAMLSSVYQEPTLPAPQIMPKDTTDDEGKLQGCPLLALPNEILYMILELTLPRTIRVPRNSRNEVYLPHWKNGNASILRTCRLLKALGTPLLYGHNEFLFQATLNVLSSCFDGIQAPPYRIRTKHFYPSKRGPWKSTLVYHHTDLNTVVVLLILPDNYIVAQKHGFGNRLINTTMRRQVERLAYFIRLMRNVEILEIHVEELSVRSDSPLPKGSHGRVHYVDAVLEPFLALDNVKEVNLEVMSGTWPNENKHEFEQQIKSGYLDPDKRKFSGNIEDTILKRSPTISQSSHYLSTTSTYYIPQPETTLGIAWAYS